MIKKLLYFLTYFFFLIAQTISAQEVKISGNVSDIGGPLPGVSVIIKGSVIGTETDFDGNYTIKAKKGDTLVFSYLGMKTVEKTVTISQQMNVVMEEDNNALKEVVITAVGIKRKPDEITTANQVVKADELNQASNPDAVQALAGKVSGLQINTTSAGLTPNTQITLRGNRSISGNNSALIVIDNVVSTAEVLSSLDPNTIESMNVIKGANGAALYGELGGAGVIIVTTKKGANDAEKFSFNIKSSLTLEEIAFLPNTQSQFGQGWAGNIETIDQGSWGAPYNGALIPVGTPDANGNFRYFPYSHINDNILPFFNTGFNLQNSISIAKGNNETGFFNFSFLRQDLSGVIPNSELEKNNYSLTLGKQFGKFGAQVIFRYTDQNTNDVSNRDVNNRREDNTYPTISMYERLSNTAGNVPIEAFNSGDNNDHWTIYEDSPYWTINNERRLGERKIIDVSGQLTYEFNEHIDAVLRGSYRKTQNDNQFKRNSFDDVFEYVGGNRSIRSFYQEDNDENRYTYADLLVNFDYNLSEEITFKSNVGLNTTNNEFDRVVNGGFDLTTPGLFSLNNVSSLQEVILESTKQRTVAAFAQIDLGYKDYLFLNLTGRYDGNSVLPKKNRYFFYPSAGIAFIPTKAFPEIKTKVLHKAKISASYVKTGNATALSPQQVPEVVNVDITYPNTGLTSVIADFESVDQNIENEFINALEANVNLEFLYYRKPRITLDISGTIGKNTNQILGTTASSSSGIFNATVNLGETKSTSLEVDLGFTPIKTENFELNGRIGYSTFKTTVEDTGDSDRIEVASIGGGTVGAYAIEGKEFPLLLGTSYQRDENGLVVVDANGTPLIDAELQILGKTTPDYILNFGINAKYKNLTFSAVADYRTGHVFYSGIRNQLTGQGRTVETTNNGRQPFIFPNSTVQGTNGVLNTTVLTAGGGNLQPLGEAYAYYTGNYVDVDENFITDATAFKIREVSLGYDLPSKVLEQFKLSRLNISVSGRNLWTSLKGNNRNYNDPEFGGRFGLAGYGVTPPTRYYSLAINVAF